MTRRTHQIAGPEGTARTTETVAQLTRIRRTLEQPQNRYQTLKAAVDDRADGRGNGARRDALLMSHERTPGKAGEHRPGMPTVNAPTTQTIRTRDAVHTLQADHAALDARTECTMLPVLPATCMDTRADDTLSGRGSDRLHGGAGAGRPEGGLETVEG